MQVKLCNCFVIVEGTIYIYILHGYILYVIN